MCKPIDQAALARAIAERTADAYSAGRYRPRAWAESARHLLDSGLNEAEVEWVLRSKYMRWAADEANDANLDTALARYMIRWPKHASVAALKAAITEDHAHG